MKARAAIAACVPLCLSLTGCPLTDHYRLQEDSLGATGGNGSDGNSSGGSSEANAGEPASNAGASFAAGGSGGCPIACNTGRCGEKRCVSGWVPTSTAPLTARSKAASVAMAEAVFIWGGIDNAGEVLHDGAIYYPATDLWIPLPPDEGSPSARMMATAVWTGSASNKVVVFGGTDAQGMPVKDGAVFDVVGNGWMVLPTPPAVGKRSAAYGYWDGTRAVFYGGLNGSNPVPAADRFDLSKWSTSTPMGDPGLLAFSATAFDGSVMYLQGGVINGVRQDKVFAYTSSTDTWASLNKSMSARTGGFGSWDGSHFVVWGGQGEAGLLADGKTMSGSTWSEMSATTVLSPRRIAASRRSGWSFQVEPGVVAMIGGQTSINSTGTDDTLAIDGATYAVQSGRWTAIPPWPSDETHEYGVGVWTGQEFVVWGGRTQNVSTLTGERWAP